MDESILFLIVKILFICLIIFHAVTLITAFVLKGKRFANTNWPYSYLYSIRFFRLGKYFDKRDWKFSNREVFGWLIVLILMILSIFLV